MPRRQRQYMNQINVVPYIDVMLVLLIIFMVTAPLINPGEIELPQVGQSLKAAVQPLEVIIRADRSLALRDHDKGAKSRAVSRNELIEAIKTKQARNPDQAVVIAAHKDVRYEEVLDVMDVLQRNEVRKIGLLAKPRQG